MNPTKLASLATEALILRRRLLPDPAQTSYEPSLWPGWWREDTALRAIRYLRAAGVSDDAVEAALLLVGCAYRSESSDSEMMQLGGEVSMAVKVLQGRPSDDPQSYWRELSEALPEHQIARAALQVALLEDAEHWGGGRRLRRVHGDAQHRLLPLLLALGDPRAAGLVQEVKTRLAGLGQA